MQNWYVVIYGATIENAVGLLKEEMRQLNSLIIEAADHTTFRLLSLAVDRGEFSKYITEKLKHIR